MTVTREQLHRLAFETYIIIGKNYFDTCAKIREGEELPGLWPKFYLYDDLTWHLGYEPECDKIVVTSLDVKHYGVRELIDDLLGALPEDMIVAAEVKTEPLPQAKHEHHPRRKHEDVVAEEPVQEPLKRKRRRVVRRGS